MSYPFTFNTGKSVLAAIERIAATSSKLEKEAQIKAAGEASTLFLKALTYAYDPFRVYGIASAPHKSEGYGPGANTLEEPMAWGVLDKLASRALTGGAARAAVQNTIDLLDTESAEVFRRIINKDMRAGFSEGTINRVFKGTIAEFPYMRCSLPAKSSMGKWDWSVGIVVQEKADGMFANVNHDKGELWVTSRTGTAFPAHSLGIELQLASVLAPSTQTHGELTVYENGELMPREKGNGVLNSLFSGGQLLANQRVVFEAWDQIPIAAVVPKGKYAVPYKTRLAGLLRQVRAAQNAGSVSIRAIPTRIVKSKAEAYAYYRELLKKGKEGVVCKHPEAIWKDGTSADQVKLKLTFEVELRVKGYVPGKPGTKTEATFGALLCSSECGLLETGVAGITDAKRLEIHNNREGYLGTVISVMANDIMEESESELCSLFLPRYSQDRLDKNRADTLEEIRAQRLAAMEAA